MWCWHRIRESETGLCPACRTPYGEDPHQFTALDVEDVLKANKEAAAAAKRERQREQHQQLNGASLESTGGGIGDDGFGATAMDVPKDRSLLANTRVIRRNLVYAVGLSPAIAREDILQKPEYFGQYGKIAKIVLNRAQTVSAEGNDPRRASASAYVTFVHKQDTLACILALDGFYLENRNIRASYGTSKYCSAFIKNVRCNNPDCTYLHDMGAAEDTFTKQEIQAGYVTSGRDVLARQQQILAEQMKQQQMSAGGVHSHPRKRVGAGGPSGTGKASANPVFPAPEFDEQAKQAPPLVPPPVGVARAASIQANLIPAQQAAMLNPATISAKLGRAASVGTTQAQSDRSPVLGAAPASQRKSIAATTAASVVAGAGRVKDIAEPQQHSSLTALTPLKRSTAKSGTAAKPPPHAEEKLPTIRNGKKASKVNAAKAALTTGSKSASNSTSNSVNSIGGDVIGTNFKSEKFSGSTGSVDSTSNIDLLGGIPIPIASSTCVSSRENRGGVASLLGGEVFDGLLSGGNANKSAIGSSKIGGAPFMAPCSSCTTGDTPTLQGSTSSLWSSGGYDGPVSGSSGIIGSHIAKPDGDNSTSALASILGINLPTGSGSLQESPSLWTSTLPAPPGPSPLSTLNGSAGQQIPPVGGSNMRMGGAPQSFSNSGGSLIGGVPIGGGSMLGSSGPFGGGSGSKSDIALLQSLLPGVHITSDTNAFGFGARNQNWNAPGQPLGSEHLPPQGNWSGVGGSHARPQGSTMGTIGQNSGRQASNQGSSGIW
jgi:CCR4-NOT transcription complex subunit 4